MYFLGFIVSLSVLMLLVIVMLATNVKTNDDEFTVPPKILILPARMYRKIPYSIALGIT